MRVLPNKYLEETEIARWLIFDNKDEAAISLAFARRLAALARDNNKQIYVSEGYRSTERQSYFYNLYLQGKGNLAAKPGTSLHEFHIAVDIGDPANFWKNKSNREWVPNTKLNQSTLNKYGLCLPLNSKDSKTIEWWHLTPIEFYQNSFPLVSFLQEDDILVDWSLEQKRIKEIDEILFKLQPVINSPDLWKKVLEGKVKPSTSDLMSLFLKLMKPEDIVNALLAKGIVTSKDYWIKVLNGREECNPEWIRILLLRWL